MLTELIRLLNEDQGEINLFELSRQLGAEPSAVAGMLETLIHIGRLVEVGSDCGTCENCALQDQCSLPVKRAKRFSVIE